ncbi:MAG: CheR family methyltransferase [Thermodesulfobacteriota bacterium]
MKAAGRRDENDGPATFDAFLALACPGLDLAWRKYRRRDARHAVLARMRELGLPDYASYLDLLRRDPAEAAGLADRMRVTVTRFFRERERWQVLAERVLPELVAAASGPRPIVRAWSAGCCGGEEPYTLAILWLERIAPAAPDASLEILGTDIDEPSLARARAGLYPASALREVPPGVRERWFGREGPAWRVADAARRMVRLENRNLMSDPVPSATDLVLCRYLPFTYFTGTRRHEAARRLWSALRPDGALMIGRKEGLHRRISSCSRRGRMRRASSGGAVSRRRRPPSARPRADGHGPCEAAEDGDERLAAHDQGHGGVLAGGPPARRRPDHVGA